LFCFFSPNHIEMEYGAGGAPKKIYADLDAAAPNEFQTTTEVVVPVVTPGVGVEDTFLQHWEYLDVNNVRTYDIPVQIGSDNYPISAEAFGIPAGFHAQQQFPVYGQTIHFGHQAPPPPPPSAPLGNESHSILIQRVPHRHRKGRGETQFLLSSGKNQLTSSPPLFLINWFRA
jgi:hypothetical protein